MRFAEAVGKTREEATEKALKKLGATIDKVEIECEEQESKGFFGLLARKEYRVKVTLKDEEEVTSSVEIDNTSEYVKEIEDEEIKDIPVDFTNQVEKARKFLMEVFESIGIKDNVEIDIQLENDNMVVKISGEEASRLIGRRGDSLDSLQMLTSLAVNKGESGYLRVLLDIENYRAKREESLTKYANKMARQATKQRRIIRLEPMNPYERRIVHSALQNDKYVKTYSEGKDPYRKVVIEPKYK